MKIFNSEGNADKAYIQVKDILLLKDCEFEKPEFIEKLTIQDGLGESDFIEFTKPEEINYIRSLDWLIDFKQVRFFSEQDLLVKKQEVEEEKSELELLLSPSRDELLDKTVSQRFNVVNNKLKYYESLIEFKRGKDSIPFPTVPDSEGFRMGESTGSYVIESGINPRILLMSRRDGKAFDSQERIPDCFLNFLMSAVVISRIGHDDNFLGGVEGDIRLGYANSRKYVLAEITTKPLEHSLEEDEPEEARGLKKVFGTLFDKFKKRNNEE